MMFRVVQVFHSLVKRSPSLDLSVGTSSSDSEKIQLKRDKMYYLRANELSN